MEARAINRYIDSSPRKMRLVIDLIRGKRASEALNILHFSPKHASRVAERVLRSAIANLQNKDESGRLETDHILVKEAFVDPGMTMKRISAAPMGRAFRIRKRSNHVTIVVASLAAKAAKASKPAAVKSAASKPAASKPAATKAKPAAEKKKPVAHEAK